MNKQDKQKIKDYFEEFIFGFIFYDVNSGMCGKANFLTALGLLCYTEFMGGLMNGKFRPGEAKKNFNTFFDYLGAKYRKFRNSHDVYDIYRCGMAHEYFIKRDFTIYMFEGDKLRIGVWELNGRYFFSVESYFRDFKKACQRFYKQMLKRRNPTTLRIISNRHAHLTGVSTSSKTVIMTGREED